MALEEIKWSDDLLTGNEYIDIQHRLLFSICDKMTTDIDVKNISAILTEFSHYAATHFEEEESLMEASGFPGLEEHKILHERIRNELVVLIQNEDSEKFSSWVRVLTFLKRWLRNHILEQDMQFADFTR